MGICRLSSAIALIGWKRPRRWPSWRRCIAFRWTNLSTSVSRTSASMRCLPLSTARTSLPEVHSLSYSAPCFSGVSRGDRGARGWSLLVILKAFCLFWVREYRWRGGAIGRRLDLQGENHWQLTYCSEGRRVIAMLYRRSTFYVD